MLTIDDRRARARIDGGGGVHALLIGAVTAGVDPANVYSIGRDADKVIQQLKLEVAALKQRLDVARTVGEARK